VRSLGLQTLRWALRTLLGAVFLLAGVGKIAEPVLFARVVAFLMPESMRIDALVLAAAIGVGTLETAIGVALLLRLYERAAVLCGMIALMAFTVALGRLLGSPDAPRCMCLSPFPGIPAEKDALAAAVRNASLIAMLGWLLCVRPPGNQASARTRPGRGPAGVAGFTIIEVLVCIVVMAILVAVALPAIAGARRASQDARRLHIIRQLGAGVELYCQANNDALPYFGTRGDPLGPVAINGFQLPAVYFRSQRWFWASLVVPQYADVPRSAIESPGASGYLQEVLGYPEFIIASVYQLTSTAFASPPYWRDDAEEIWNQPSYFAPTHMFDVRYPSLKGLLIADITGPGGFGPRTVFPCAMADGSVRSPRRSDFDLSRAVTRPYGSTSFPVEATKDGLSGRDF
jgi:prepilin-type N-terminal cleavage/methylation domain-containing protein